MKVAELKCKLKWVQILPMGKLKWRSWNMWTEKKYAHTPSHTRTENGINECGKWNKRRREKLSRRIKETEKKKKYFPRFTSSLVPLRNSHFNRKMNAKQSSTSKRRKKKKKKIQTILNDDETSAAIALIESRNATRCERLNYECVTRCACNWKSIKKISKSKIVVSQCLTDEIDRFQMEWWPLRLSVLCTFDVIDISFRFRCTLIGRIEIHTRALAARQRDRTIFSWTTSVVTSPLPHENILLTIISNYHKTHTMAVFSFISNRWRRLNGNKIKFH